MDNSEENYIINKVNIAMKIKNKLTDKVISDKRKKYFLILRYSNTF